jgi:tetratricopeptide (TPR) repeat protein
VALALVIPVYFSARSSLKPLFPILIVSICAFVVAAPQLEVFRLTPHHPFLMDGWSFRDFDPVSYLILAGSYITALFWGPDANLAYHAYKPFWGGFLNPLMDSMFFLGAVEVVRDVKNNRLYQWIVFAVVLFLMPVLLAKNFEMFRLIELLPLLLLVSVLGLQTVLRTLEGKRRLLFLSIFWICSSGIDLYHLTVRYPEIVKKLPPELWDGYGFQRPCFDAYQILNRYAVNKGPGLILNDFTAPLETDPKEQSLTAACYPFDAGRNGHWQFQNGHWAAVFVEDIDVEYLKKRFTTATWYGFGPSLYANSTWYSAIGYATPQRRYFMMWILIDPENAGIMKRWNLANLFIQDLLYQGLNPFEPDYRERMRENLANNHFLFQGDPFLENHYWNLVQENLWAANQPKDLVIEAVRSGLREGYPTAEKYHLLGNLLYQTGKYSEALEAFKKAGVLNPALKPPSMFIKLLKTQNNLAGSMRN